MPKRRNAQEAERLQKTAKDISEKLGLKLPDKPSDKPPARLNPTGYKVAQGNLAPDSQSQPYPKTELDHDLDGSLLSLWGADDKLTTAVHDRHEPLLQSTRVSVARASVATNAHRSSGVGGPVPPAGDHRLSVLAIPKVSHMDSKVGEQRASRPMRRSVAKRTAFIMAPPTTVSLDRTKSTSAGKHDPLTDEPSADAEGGDVVMTDNANASSAGTASGVGAASGGGLAVGSMPGSGGHDGLIASPDTFRSRHGSITLTPGGKLPSSFSQNTGILAGSITALTTSNPGLLGSLTTISNPTHGQPSSGRSDPHPTWLSVETDPGASTRINRAHRDSVFGKAPTGRLPGQSLISPKGKRPSQSEEALSVMLVGQKVKYKPDKDAHQHSQHHDMHMSQDDGLHQSMDGNVPDETIDGPAVIMEDAEEEDDDDQLQMLRRSRNGRAGPIHLAPMIVGDGHASDDDDAADHRHHGQASHGLSSVGHVSHAGHTAGADSKRGETHHKHEEVEPFDFDQVDDVDQISTRYAAIIEARARKLRGEDVPTPPPMTPAEIIKREVVKPTAAAAFLGVNGRGRFDAAAHNAVAPDDEVEDEDDEDEDEEKEEEEEEEEDAKSSESGSDSSGEEEGVDKDKADEDGTRDSTADAGGHKRLKSVQVSYRLSTGADTVPDFADGETEPPKVGNAKAPKTSALSRKGSDQVKSAKKSRPVLFTGVPSDDGSSDRGKDRDLSSHSAGASGQQHKPPLAPYVPSSQRPITSPPEKTGRSDHGGYWKSSVPPPRQSTPPKKPQKTNSFFSLDDGHDMNMSQPRTGASSADPDRGGSSRSYTASSRSISGRPSMYSSGATTGTSTSGSRSASDSRSGTGTSGSGSGSSSTPYRSMLTSAGTGVSSFTSGPSSASLDAPYEQDAVEMTLSEQAGISNWQEDMVIKSIQLIAETRKKRTADQDLAASKRDTSDSPLPFAKYTIPDTFLEHYRPYFDPELIDRRMALQQEDNAKIAAASAASGTGKTGEVPIAAPAATTGMLTTRDDQREGQDGAKDKSGEKRNLQPQSSKTQKPNNAGRSSSLSKRTDGRRGNNARIEFREVLEAEQRMDDAQPSHQPSDRKTDGDGLQGFGLKVAGARMHFEMGTLGRGTAALGTNWAPVPPAMSIPGLLFHPQKSVTQTLPPSPMFQLPKTQETTIEPVATGRKSDPSKPTGQHGLIAPALVLEPLGEDEMDVSMEDYESDKRAHASFSSKKQPPDAADPISQEATAEWISPDALIAPSPFGVGMQIADDAQTANVPLDLPRSSDQPPKPQQPPESPPESPPEQPPPSLSAVSSKESSKANIAGQASNRKPSFTDAKPGQQSRKSVGGLNVPRLSVQHGSTPRAKAMRQRSHTTVGFMVHGKKKETSLAVPPPSTRNSVVPSESASVAGQPDPASNPKIAETGSAAAPSATSASAISAPSSSESGEQSAEVKGEKDGAVAASAVSSPDAATDTKPTSAGKKKLWKMVKKTIRKHSVFSSMRNPPNGKRRSISQGGAAYSGASDSYDDEGEQEEGQDSLAWSVTSSRNAAGGTGPGQRRRLMSMDGRPSIVEEPDEGELGALPPGRRVSTTPARMRRQSQRRDSSMSTTPAAAAAPSAPDNPALFYAKKWRKSAGSNAAGGSPAAIGDGLSSIPTSSRPSIGVVVSILAAELPHHADKKHGHDHHGDNGEDGMEPDADSAVLATRRLLLHAMQANGFTRGVGQTLYQVVHDIARRKNGMNSIERARFPTFDDPGPPLDATGTPMLSPDGSEVPGLTVEYINSEITRLDGVIEASSVPIPANLRKRGMLLSRVGRFNQAMDDLDRAIQYDPFNSDALWHRHQLYLRQNEVESALRDLDNITENNKVHLGAFQTKARIYQALGIIKLAIVNYSAVIRLKPEDADGYYNRACLFEAENEMVYANEDFRMVRQLDPTNEHAIYNLAIYSFQKQLWEDAIQAFSKLIVLNPENAQGHLFRGRAYASIAKFEEALDDITAAIRILPNRAQYFFHRGCLLRDRNPSRAIQDLSVSILLDDTIGNCDAFYQRAKLYDKLKCHDLAIADYVSVIELDPTKSRAYLNLGILHMRYFGEYDRALYCLNKSIANDPINLQAYLCRGELYQMLHKETLQEIADLTMPSSRHKTRHVNREHLASSYVDKAIKDYSRAIHLSPKNYLLFLYRGRLLLKQGLMAEATMDFHAAFDLNASIAQTFIQRSLVLCFQRKYKQVIEEFDERKKIQTVEDPQLLLLIAKARIRCGDFRGALRDLSSALDFSQNDPQIFLQRGICFEHLRDWGSASLEFSKCIMFMPTYAKAYYHRGLCKLYEGNDSGVADLDLAIMHDDKFFEAFLTRASYHHAKGMYAKGIEDCNEALKLEPTSIRSHLLRGACKCKLNQYSLAINDFSKAINIDKTSHFAFYNRAVTNQLLNDLDNAIKDYSIVLLLHDDSNAYRNRALIYWKKGDHENALLDLYAARDHFPQDGKLRGLLGLCLQKVARNQESIAEFTVALELNPFMMEALLGRGNVYASMGDLTRARRDYARVIHMYPRCAEAYVNVAYTMQTESRPRKAWTIFSIALTMDRQCTAALEGRAIVHLAIKNPFAAMVDITRAIEIHPANAEFLTNRGVIYQALNDDVSALQSYKAAIAADASYALAYFNAANLYLRQKLWEHAATYFDKALEINNLDKAALLNRGICKVMLKDNMGALQDLNRAAEIDPNSPQVHFNRGLLLQSLGKHAQAEAAYSRVVELVPTDSIAYMRRGQTRGLQAHWKEAMQDYTMSIAAEEQ